MTENDYTPTQITLPNGRIVRRINNFDDPIVLESERMFQGFPKSFPVSERSLKPADDSHGYTDFDMRRAYNTLYTEYGLATYEEVMAEKRFVHLVFVDGMELDYFPSLEHWRISPEKEMVDFVMQHRPLPIDNIGDTMNSQKSPKVKPIDILLTALATIGIAVLSLTVQDITGFMLGLGAIVIALIVVRVILAGVTAEIRKRRLSMESEGGE